MNDDRPASLFRYQATIWIHDQFFILIAANYLQTLHFSFWGALSSERTGLYFIRTSATALCQRCHTRAHVLQNLRPFHTVSFETGFLYGGDILTASTMGDMIVVIDCLYSDGAGLEFLVDTNYPD
jgi:hypothetical protein